MNEIIMLNLKMPYGNAKDLIHPAIFRDGNKTILVDCGFVGSLPLIEADTIYCYHGGICNPSAGTLLK